jgi:Flp pilus assembly protein TadG
MTRSSRAPASRRRQRGITIVEFALVSPILLLLLMGCVLVGIVAMNQMQLSNAVREGARAAALCGGPSRNSQQVTPTLPDGRTPCDSRQLAGYVNSLLSAVPGGAATSVCVYAGSQAGSTSGATCVSSDPVDPNVLDKCSRGSVVQVDISYPQQLYVPLIGGVLGDSGTTRTLRASAQATCER